MAVLNLGREALLGNEEEKGFSFVDVLLIVMLLFLIVNIVVQSVWLAPVKVDGDSMNITLQNEDWLYMSKIKKPKAGDVVVFVKSENVNYIKRIVALEGDSVRSKNGIVQVKKKGSSNWVNFDDKHAYYSKKPYGTFWKYNAELGTYVDIPETKVGKGEMYVLGDNRWDSQDSRNIGLVKTSSILGIVPEWAIKHKDKYAGYLEFVEKVSTWFRKQKNA